MDSKKTRMTRRHFLHMVGAAGIGALSSQALSPAEKNRQSKHIIFPTRSFGKSGIQVPILALGGGVNFIDNPVLLRQAIRYGITYWDTARSYARGNSEKGIGLYFEKYPQDRKKIFLVTKSKSNDIADMEKDLDVSLERLKTSCVDLFFMHNVEKKCKNLGPDMKKWMERMKAKGKIRLFGFSTHKDMEPAMMAAAKLGWIDGIMMSYNYRLMFKDEMKRAVNVCAKAGIGLTAMKTQATFLSSIYSDVGSSSKKASALAERFEKKGFSEEQAKLKAVWSNPRIAGICSKMTNFKIMRANVAAAMDKKALSSLDMEVFREYAENTAPGYCAGCARNCENAIDDAVPVSDILRYMMYAHGYGETSEAKRLFASLPGPVKGALGRLDFSAAERKCPHNIAIGSLMKDAGKLLA